MLLEEILDAAGASYRWTSKRNEVVLCCPFCITRGLSDDTNYHLGLNISSGLAHCFRCDWAAHSLVHSARQLARAYNVGLRLRYADLKQKEEDPVRRKKDKELRLMAAGLPAEYERFGSGEDEIEAEARRFLKRRGVTQSQLVRHEIGFAGSGPLGWRVLFPVMGVDRQVYSTVGRALREDMQPKYLNTTGVKLLWGLHQSGTKGVLCEGIFDALAVERAIANQRGFIALARLGSVLTPSQIKELREFERVIVLPDKDVPGVKGASTLAAMCAEAGIKVDICVPDAMTNSDPGDMGEVELREYIASARPWSKENGWRMRAATVRRG